MTLLNKTVIINALFDRFQIQSGGVCMIIVYYDVSRYEAVPCILICTIHENCVNQLKLH
jgi:hypothetical protein